MLTQLNLLISKPQGDPMGIEHCSKISTMTRTNWQNLNDSRLVLQLPLPNPLKPGVTPRMQM